MITIVSDHGHHAVHTHFDVAVELGERYGIKTAYHSWPAFRPSFDAVVCVSGNGMCHIYFRGEDGTWATRPSREVIESAPPRADRVAPGRARGRASSPPAGDDPGSLIVESKSGVADLAETAGGGVTYSAARRARSVRLGRDAYRGWDSREALEETIDTESPRRARPDRPALSHRRTGDLVISASGGLRPPGALRVAAPLLLARRAHPRPHAHSRRVERPAGRGSGPVRRRCDDRPGLSGSARALGRRRGARGSQRSGSDAARPGPAMASPASE